jgi:RNA polymerase sigma-54 factor
MKQGLILKQQQRLELKQKLNLTQQLQQAVKVLQAGQNQLLEMIEQEALENPVLEVKGGSDSSENIPAIEEEPLSKKQDTGERDKLLNYVRDFQKYFQESQDAYYSDEGSYGGDYSQDESSSFEEYVADLPSLSDVLEEQLNLSISNETQRKIGKYIIASIDENGYLKETTLKIAGSLLVSEEEVLGVLELVQTFEPTGVASRDLRECLLIQYKTEQMDDPLVHKLIDNHLENLGNNRMKEIQRATKASFEEISQALARIRQFNPRPAAGYMHEVSTAEVIRPDLFVEIEDDELKITLNESFIPSLDVNNYYQQKIKSAEGLSKDELVYLKKKLESAMWFRQCIEKRNETIYNVAKCIFEIQFGFFKDGVRGLRPLTLSDVAKRVDRHEATISRVINGKYAHTPVGVFELKFFFSGGLKSEDGDSVSSLHIKEVIQKAISEEEPKKPLSDQILCDLLRAKGIEIARRTVAKYREGLGIPSSSKRKKYI